MRTVFVKLSLTGVFALAACGQAPSFVDATTGGLRGHDSSGGGGDSGESAGSGDGTVADGSGGGSGSSGSGGGDGSGSGGSGGSASNGGGSGGGGSNGGGSGGGGTTPPYVVPNANPSDNTAIQRCLAKWKNLPFATTITNYKRIYAAISVNSNAVVIDDTAQTSTPQLILVDAGVAVGGSPIYNLRNQNGYYCMKVSVNVKTNLNINLACNARLADSLVQVNVGSNANTTNAAVGVNVGSNVTVKTIDQTGSACHQ